MQFSHLVLYTADSAVQYDFYANTLRLPECALDIDILHIQTGWSHLVFEESVGFTGRYHFAWNVPRNQFAAAKAWLASRVPLVVFDGQDQFHSQTWNADYSYFYDAAGNICEFIARHTLANDLAEPFSAASLAGISEIGIGCADVMGTAARLGSQHGLSGYHASPNPDFMPMGDENGMLILVDQARIWYPDTGIVAGTFPVHVTTADPATISFNSPTG